MGRRRVRGAAPPSDCAVGSAAGIPSSDQGLTDTSNGGEHTAAAAVAAGGGAAPAGKEDDKNPLMGLLHYGSDSDDGEAPAGSLPTKSSTAVSSALSEGAGGAAAAPASSSSNSNPAGEEATVTYVLPSGWQQCMDNAGLVYFWNTETGETAWDPPEGTEIRRSPTATAAAAAAPADAAAAAEVTGPSEASADPSKTAAAAAIAGEGQAGSDATSDTASEAEEDRVEETKAAATAAAAAGVSGDNFGEPGEVPATSDEDETRRRSPRSAAGHSHVVAEDGSATANQEDGDEADAPPQPSTAAETNANAAALGGTAAGVDDLLAGIEAELLSGGGDGSGGGNDGDAGGGAADRTCETSAEGREEEDFSPLRLVAPGLDTRALEAHADLTASLAAAAGAEKDGGAGAAAAGEGDGMLRLGIELAAVLRSRLSDWREGKDGEVVRGVECISWQNRLGSWYTCITTTIGGHTAILCTHIHTYLRVFFSTAGVFCGPGMICICCTST